MLDTAIHTFNQIYMLMINDVSDKTWAISQGPILVVIVHSARYYSS